MTETETWSGVIDASNFDEVSEEEAERWKKQLDGLQPIHDLQTGGKSDRGEGRQPSNAAISLWTLDSGNKASRPNAIEAAQILQTSGQPWDTMEEYADGHVRIYYFGRSTVGTSEQQDPSKGRSALIRPDGWILWDDEYQAPTKIE